MYQSLAIHTIHQAISKNGLLASANAIDNYAHVWSRDSMMTGIAGMLINDEKIMDAWKQSILTLANHVGSAGQIPSNVAVSVGGKTKVSYGSLVGRVDATTWWIIGSCLYCQHTNDDALKQKLAPIITQSLQALKSWEYNDKQLLYTPIGGNWADEYICSGYTLYDNVLRYWALLKASKLYENNIWQQQASSIKLLIQENFSTQSSTNNTAKYHAMAYASFAEKNQDYYACSFAANGYNTQWDMAGNALALLLNINTDANSIENYLKKLNIKFGHWMLPVFYPIIKPTDWQWNLLENNFSFKFKNIPFHFHNGGSWPIFLGWLSAALQQHGKHDTAQLITSNYETLMQQNDTMVFNEYWSTDKLNPGGINNLCFSASGYVYMKNANEFKKILNN